MEKTTFNRDLLRTLVWAGLVLFGVFLGWRFLAGVASVVLLILFGVLLAVILSAPVEALHRRKVPRAVSSPLIVLGILGILALVGYLFFPQLAQQSSQLSFGLPSALNDFIDRVQRLASSFGLNFASGGGFSFSDLARRLVGGVLGLFNVALYFAAGAVAAVFLAVYLAASPEPVVAWVIRLFPPKDRLRVREILSESRESLLGWVKGQLVSMTIIGTLSAVALYIIGIPGAVILGVLSGLLEFVPYVGPILSAVPPLLLGLLGEPIHAVYVLVAYVLIQQLESNVITPLVMREAADVHPAVAISSATLLGVVFGLLGALLAIPMVIVANVLVHELWFRRLEGDDGREAP